jgi:hypothetical protein
MILNGREITVNDREPTTDDLAAMQSQYTMARMPEATKLSWSASARELRPPNTRFEFTVQAMVWDFE